MNSKIPLKIKNKLKKILIKKDVIDIIIFGSAVKGKFNPGDIDIAIITERDEIKPELNDENLHISKINIRSFFTKPITLTNTLLREGYSLRHDKPFSEVFKFSSKVMFFYELKNLSNTDKVRIVNTLRGKKDKGLVEKHGGEWISRQVFLVPPQKEKIFEELFLTFNAKFKKTNLLIH